MKQLNAKYNFDFMGRRRLAIIGSLVMIAISVGSLAVRGLNFGIDFTGGVLLEVGYEGDADLTDIRGRLAAADFADAQVQTFGASNDVLIRLLPRESVTDEEAGDEGANVALAQRILDVLQGGGASVDLRRVEFVGPQIGEELTERGGTAMIFALLMILGYIMFRFQWKFAVGAVGALIHDVLITIGFFSVLQIPFDLSVLAAVLAVIGYSLNDTIVVFDRIRENFRGVRRGTAVDIANTSINQTLSRTLITGITTLLVLISLFLLGGESVRGFSIALIVGIVVGTYSSVYTATAIALALNVTPQDLMEPQKEELVDEMP